MLNVLLAIAGITLILLYINQLVHNVAFGWASLLFTAWVNYTFGMNQSSIGGFNLSPPDFVSIGLIVAGAIRTIPRIREDNNARLVAFGYLAIFTFNYLRGVASYGFSTASNETRGYVGTISAFLYFLTVPADEESLKKIVRYFMWYVGGLYATAILAYAGLPVGAVAWAHTDADQGIDGRFLPSGAAAAIACAFIFSLVSSRWRQNVFVRVAPAFLLGLAIFLRHRTIWLMLLAVILVLFLVERTMARRLVPTLMALTILGTAIVYFAPSEVSQEQSSRIENATQEEGTLLWRLNSWQELISDETQGVVSVLIGKPVGSGFWRFTPESGTYTNLPPHSEYVQQYLRVGTLGMICLLTMFFRPLSQLWRFSRSDQGQADISSPSTWLLIVIACIAYGVTYSLEPDLYALLALANTVTLRHRQTSLLQYPAESFQYAMPIGDLDPRLNPAKRRSY